MGYYDESNAFTLGSKISERTAQVVRFKELGNKLSILFWMNIGSIIFSFLIVFGGAAIGLIQSKGLLYFIAILLMIAGLAFSVVYGVILLSMGKYNDRMKTAGICYLATAVISIANNLFFKETWIGTLMNIATIVLVLVYMVQFTKAMEEMVYSANSYISGSWETIRKIFFGSLIALIISVIVAALIPVLGLFALGICFIALIAMFIWNLVLIYKSANALKFYIPE